jgi:hypothetical protein
MQIYTTNIQIKNCTSQMKFTKKKINNKTIGLKSLFTLPAGGENP